MNPKTRLALALAGLLIAASLATGACLVRTVAVVDPGPPIEYGYQPMLYNGYVVYYTDDGIPFFWDAGVRIYIPMAYRTVYINHWHSHRHAYGTWYQHRGNHYRSRRYKGSSHSNDHRSGGHDSRPVLTPKRSDRHDSKPVLRPDRGGSNQHDSKPVLRPDRGGSKDSSKPTLEPKKKEKKKKKDADKPTLKPK